MDITCLSMSMPRGSSLNTCKVLHISQRKNVNLHIKNPITKNTFLPLFSGEAESGLERLHQCAEKELQGYLNVDKGPSKDFNEFRMKLAGLTR